jgi:putative restriction endonuclease
MVSGSQGTAELWVYGWTLTPGGRPQLKNKYRIQMTSVTSPLQVNPNGPTVLVGYEPNLNMFAGFDIGLHGTFTTGSPSVQINIQSIYKALQDGMAFHRKENNEITVAMRPDHFMAYARDAESLHRNAKHSVTFNLLTKVSSLEPIAEDDFRSLNRERRRLLQTISRVSRDANFRERVLNAYGHRCAVTRMQLRLVEAAHILPVSRPESIDDVRNGIALSPTYHRALDSGLIYLADDYTMSIDPRHEARLLKLDLTAGLEGFKRSLGRIHLPADRRQWPHPSFIKKANRLRGIGS